MVDKNQKYVKKLSTCGLGIACGTVWGLGSLFLGLFNVYGDWGGELLGILSSLYIGFDYTIKGSLIGLLWGLFHGFISGFLVASIYNLCLQYCPCKTCKGSSCDINGKSCCG